METPSFYDVFERMWQLILEKINNYATNENFNNHVSDGENPHGVTKEQLDLEYVDNTSDVDKPISNATQEALNAKADAEHAHDAEHITSGVLGVEYGGTGCNSIIDNTYDNARYRASALVYTETTPYDNGTINWVYE